MYKCIHTVDTTYGRFRRLCPTPSLTCYFFLCISIWSENKQNNKKKILKYVYVTLQTQQQYRKKRSIQYKKEKNEAARNHKSFNSTPTIIHVDDIFTLDNTRKIR